MSILVAALFILRLFFWRLFPEHGTAFTGDILFGVLCLATIALYRLAKTRSPLAPFMFMWLLASGISFFWSSSSFVSAYSLFLLSIYTLTFCWIVGNTQSRSHITFLWWVIVTGAVVSAGIGIWEYFLMRSSSAPQTASQMVHFIYDIKRSCSLQGWPTAFAGFLILALPTVFLLRGYLTGFFFGTLVLGLISSFSILPALSLGTAFIISKSGKNIKWLLLGLGSIIYLAWETKSMESFLIVRGGYYQAAWTMITQHPFVGGGLGTYVCTTPSTSTYAHNSYFQVWAETGTLGFLALSGLAIVFFRMKPGKSMLQTAMYIGILAVFIDNLFSFTMLKPNLSFVWWIALALYSNLQQGRVKNDSRN